MIQNETNKNEYVASLGQTTFTYSFRILDQTHILVKVNGIIGILGSDYTVSGVNSTTGGTVTFLGGRSQGDLVELFLNPPFTQLTAYLPNSKFPETSHETALDKLTMMALTLKGTVDTFANQVTQSQQLTTTVPAGSNSINITLAIPFDSSNYSISVAPNWPSNGWWITNKTTSGFTINFPVSPDTDSSVGWKADNLTFVQVSDADLTIPTFASGSVVFASGGTQLTQADELSWDSSLKRLKAGSALLGNTNNISTVLSAPNNTANRSANYFTFSDPGNHANQLHSVVAISGQPVGSGTNGPPHLDAGLTISNLKQNFSTPSSVGGEVSGLYTFVRQGSQGDCDGLLVDVAAYNNNGFTNVLEGINRKIVSNVEVLNIDVQAGVINTGTGIAIGFAATPLIGAGTHGLFLGGTWSNGVDMTTATVGNAIALGNNQTITWKDNGGTLRQVLIGASDNTVVLGWDAATPSNGHIIFRGGGNELARLAPGGTLSSGQTVMSLRYHNGSSVVEQQVTLGAADSGGSGFKVLRIPN